MISERIGHVLIAEDNAALAGVLEFNIQRAGCDVTVASTGSRAIEMLQARPYDLILTDFQMPGACGEDVCHAARSHPLHLNTPLILCSAKGFELDTERLRKVYDLAAVEFKPFSPTDIARKVRRLVEERATCH